VPLQPQVKKVLLDDNTPAAVLLVLIADQLGADMLVWDPETIKMEVEELLGAPVPPGVFNKLMAAIELVTTDGFYKDLPTFIRLCNTLYNGTLNLEEFDPADAAEIAWGITEALLIWPPETQEEEPFAPKIIGYIAHALEQEGIMTPPDVLRLGAPDTALWDRVNAEFSDDPAMFNAVRDIERAKGEEIDALVKERLRYVLELLEALPLQNGTATGAVQNMLAALRRTDRDGSQLQPI